MSKPDIPAGIFNKMTSQSPKKGSSINPKTVTKVQSRINKANVRRTQ